MHNVLKEQKMPVDFLRAAISYNAETGETSWKERPVDHFSNGKRHTQGHVCSFWNSRFAGKSTGSAKNKHGYRFIRLSGSLFLAHRVAWAITTGQWPTGEIDHIDGDTGNNRFKNLRVVDRVGNTRNSGFRSDNASGVCGVSRLRSRNRWLAYIALSNRRRLTKHFPLTNDGLLDAAKWREEKIKELGYHPNHGK